MPSASTPPVGPPALDAHLPRRVRIGYALGSLGTGGFSTVPGLLLLYYLTDVLGVRAALAGVIVFAPKAWDVVLNPWIGARSDRTSSRWGPRHPWMLGGALALPVLFALMFAAPAGWSTGLAASWVAATYVLAATAFGAFQVPYIALPAEITDSYHERTRLMSLRIVLLTVAILAFGAGAPAVVSAAGGGTTGYRTMGLVAAVALAVGLLGATVGTYGAPLHAHADPEPSLRTQLRVAARNRPFRLLFAAFVLQALATGAMLAAAPYVATYVLGDPAATTVLFASLVGPALLVMPLWSRVSRRLGKHRGFLLASLLFTAGALGLTGARALPHAAVYGLVAACGIAYAGMQLFPLAMLPDTIAADAASSGRRRAGIFTGVWTAGETGGLALGPALYALALGLGGFVSSRPDHRVLQPETALTAISLGFSLLPAVLLLASLPLLLRYDLTADRLAAATEGTLA